MNFGLTYELNHDVLDRVRYAQKWATSLGAHLHDHYFGGEVDGIQVGVTISPKEAERFYQPRSVAVKKNYTLEVFQCEPLFLRTFVIGDIVLAIDEVRKSSDTDVTQMLRSELAKFVSSKTLRVEGFDSEACARAIDAFPVS